ncbi:glutamate--tRNA ligase MSE1, partial [Ascoidea rubescens DSM 1968]
KEKFSNPLEPVRTRFAPSPTGYLHFGSLRTALFNYLLAKATKGTFILRIEDTDQSRLIPDAEQNIIKTLRWCGLDFDEGPTQGGNYGPYKQSERTQIYEKYINQLLENKKVYRCFCSKERLNGLTESAKLLQPPTNVSYDRHCADISIEESNKRAQNNESYTIRFKSPEIYPVLDDVLHGKVNLQPQVNYDDRRYDDPILIKSDGLPTYHFACVIDDHLMKITHVIRGEEWLPSTPKHIALYKAFGWNPPKFVHVPLLTTLSNRKLSKRHKDSDILSLKNTGYLPEAIVNFIALLGSGVSTVENNIHKAKDILPLDYLQEKFKLNKLSRCNIKIEPTKLDFLNIFYLRE